MARATSDQGRSFVVATTTWLSARKSLGFLVSALPCGGLSLPRIPPKTGCNSGSPFRSQGAACALAPCASLAHRLHGWANDTDTLPAFLRLRRSSLPVHDRSKHHHEPSSAPPPCKQAPGSTSSGIHEPYPSCGGPKVLSQQCRPILTRIPAPAREAARPDSYS